MEQEKNKDSEDPKEIGTATILSLSLFKKYE